MMANGEQGTETVNAISELRYLTLNQTNGHVIHTVNQLSLTHLHTRQNIVHCETEKCYYCIFLWTGVNNNEYIKMHL